MSLADEVREEEARLQRTLTTEEHAALGSRRWRLVCHGCGHRFPLMAAVATQACCLAPDLHVHNLTAPCFRCRDEVAP